VAFAASNDSIVLAGVGAPQSLTLERTGGTAAALQVTVTIGNSQDGAVNFTGGINTDDAVTSGNITFAEGSPTATIAVVAAHTGTVTLTIVDGDAYDVGSYPEASISITVS
jgi:hypothetical protein